MRKVTVYIASPYTFIDKDESVNLQIEIAYNLLKLGFNTYMPLYCHFIQKAHPDIDKNFPWLELDKQWLNNCDIMVRLHLKDKSGIEIISRGSDEEEQYAKENGIPIFHYYSLEELVRSLQTFENTI